MIPKHQEKTTKVLRWKPFVSIASIAAVVAALIAAGTFFLDKGNDDTGFTVIQGDNDYFADIQNLTEDDIVEYLISTGVELEDIEQY
jgi:putative intracellular protease/amidase